MPSPQPARDSNGLSGLNTGWAIVSTMVAGILVWGAIGFVIDRLVWSRLVFTGLGIVIGAAASIYLVYIRYGRTPS